MMKIRTIGIVALLGTMALGACSGSKPDEPPALEENVAEVAPEPVATAAPLPEPERVPDEVAAPAPPPAEEVAPDVQVQDDADATGMTARVQRDAVAANETEQP